MSESPTTESDEELLTAYLDGELSESETIAVEQRLGDDVEFHAKMKSLQQAWDLLDNLPSVKASNEFLKTTMELAVSPSERTGIFANWLSNIALFVALPFLLLGGSYLYARHSLGAPKRELVRDLPLIENFDRYSKAINIGEQPADGIRFLHEISRLGLFSDVEDLFSSQEASPKNPAHAETAKQNETVSPDPAIIDEREQWMQGLSSDERNDLLNKKSEFDQLDESRKQVLRELHQQLTQHPDRKQLTASLVSYYQWLTMLRMKERAGLLDEPVNDRLKTIRSITRRQAEDAFGKTGSTKLPAEDAAYLYKWYDFVIQDKAKPIRERSGQILSQKRQRSNLPPPSASDLERVQAGPIEQLVEFLMENDRDHLGTLLMQEEIGSSNSFGLQYLYGMLSDDSKKILDQVDPEGQRELVLNWLEAANKTRLTISRATLQKLYDSLPSETRDEMDNMHPDTWKKTLLQKYESENGRQSDNSAKEEWRKMLKDRGFDYEFDQ
jgi:hypothetical protein